MARRTLGAVDTAATIIPRVVAMERAKVAGNLEDEVPEFGWEDCWMQLVSNTAVNYTRLGRVYRNFELSLHGKPPPVDQDWPKQAESGHFEGLARHEHDARKES